LPRDFQAAEVHETSCPCLTFQNMEESREEEEEREREREREKFY
jgi:hypothetical protein